MATIGFALLLSAIAGLADVIGGALMVVRRLTHRQTILATALGSGFLLGATVLDRLPDAMRELPYTAAIWMIAGYLLMLLLDRYGAGHHHPARSGAHVHEGASAAFVTRRAGFVTLVGMLVHTAMDGVVIAGAFDLSRAAGILMFLAITLHKLPEGFSMATVALAAGESRSRALYSSALLALSTLCGSALTLWLGAIDMGVVKVVMALATGSFLFISTTAMIPAVKESGERMAAYVVILGVVLFFISLILVKSVGLT